MLKCVCRIPRTTSGPASRHTDPAVKMHYHKGKGRSKVSRRLSGVSNNCDDALVRRAPVDSLETGCSSRSKYNCCCKWQNDVLRNERNSKLPRVLLPLSSCPPEKLWLQFNVLRLLCPVLHNLQTLLYLAPDMICKSLCHHSTVTGCSGL